MNIFGIGTAELILIILIMLVVAGPKRMVRWAYYLGQFMGKLRRMWVDVAKVIQKEVDEAGIDMKIPKELPTRQNLGKYINELAKPYAKELEASMQDIQKPVEEALTEVDKAVNVNLTEPQKAANPQAKPDFGAWGKPAPRKPETTASDTSQNGGFGAWSKPQRPGQQPEHKAD